MTVFPGTTVEVSELVKGSSKILFDGLGGLGDAEMTYLGKLYAEPFKTLVAREEEGANPRKMTVKF